jgi:hypothetical protein
MTASQRSTTSFDITDNTINIHMYAKKPKKDVIYSIEIIIYSKIEMKFTIKTLYNLIRFVSGVLMAAIHIAQIINKL